MGESACLMHTFSCSSDTHPHEPPKEANPIRALGESISFGRFMSESLAWEKWSSFNHNRYIEEVEKYSKPGSVAQKKAYFEAHYKKIAEKKKAAALLEQANTAANEISQPEVDDGVDNCDAQDSNFAESNCHLVVEEPTEAADADTEVDAKECSNGGEVSEIGSAIVEEADPAIESEVIVENMQIDSLNHHEDDKNKKVTEAEISTTKQIDENPSKESSALASRMRPDTSLKSSVYNRTTRLPSSTAGPRTPLHLRRENNSTPDSKKYTKDSVDKKRSTPKSLHMSINFAPPSRSGDAHKISSSFLQKNRDPMVASNLSKASKDCVTPLRTPARASVNGVPKLPPVTPKSESRRTKPPLEQISSGSRKMDIKWQSLSVDRSKSSSSWGNKTMSPTISSCFRFRSEERAAKRKEHSQKLEEKFNAQEEMQLKAKSKEKVDAELKKLRRSLSFKAKPMPDFYRETESSKTQIKKIPLTRPRSPKLGRKPSSSAVQDKSALPPRKPAIKNDGSKLAIEKTVRTTTRSVSSLPKRNAHENASPNIQS